MKKEQKELLVKKLEGILSSSKAVVLVSHKGLTVEETTQMRKTLRKDGSNFMVIKNTLFHRAIAQKPWEFFSEQLKGPMGLIYTNGDPTALAKTLLGILKETDKIEFVNAAVGTRKCSSEDMKMLASLPSENNTRAMLLGALKGVPTKFLGLLQAPMRNFIGVLEARRQSLEKAG